MTIKHQVRKLARRFGLEVHRHNPAQSENARLVRQLVLHEIDTVLDVGANDGGYARYLRQGGYTGNILSFEPLEEPYVRLRALSASDRTWHVAPRMALGAERGEVEINVAGNSKSSSLLPMKDLHVRAAPQSAYVGVQRIPLERIDGVSHPIIESARALMLKIDTQGYEMPVLLGAKGLLRKVRGIQVEMSLVPLYEQQVLYRDMIDWLNARGYSLWNVIPGFVDPDTGRMLQVDGVFFHESSRDGNAT